MGVGYAGIKPPLEEGLPYGKQEGAGGDSPHRPLYQDSPWNSKNTHARP